MSTDISIVDIVIHLHPDTTPDCKDRIEKNLRALDGVISVHFSEEDHPHALIVAYDPDDISSEGILAEVRKCDREAVMAGL